MGALGRLRRTAYIVLVQFDATHCEAGDDKSIQLDKH